MTIGFVIGNGQSRLAIDLDRLRGKGKIYGCNALYRSFTPDVLVATDTPIATRIQAENYAKQNVFYTRKPMPGSGARGVELKYYGFSSGQIAAALAAKECEVIFLLGFDFGTNEPPPKRFRKHSKKQKPISQHYNNVYAGTEFYKNPSDPPTFGGNWIKQIITIARDFPEVVFYRVVGFASVRVDINQKNLNTLEMRSFLELLNTL
jgi:hypothetical protein